LQPSPFELSPLFPKIVTLDYILKNIQIDPDP